MNNNNVVCSAPRLDAQEHMQQSLFSRSIYAAPPNVCVSGSSQNETELASPNLLQREPGETNKVLQQICS